MELITLLLHYHLMILTELHAHTNMYIYIKGFYIVRFQT